MADTIHYGNMMHRAMRGLIAEVLTDVSENGLPGDHHFFITFDTQNPDVEMADRLFDRYPEEMTIVVQHWFDGLVVAPEGFQITLNFGDTPEPLSIPFDAIRTFVDPSVEFGLRFESHEDPKSELEDLPELDLSDLVGGGEEQAAPQKPQKPAEKGLRDTPAEVVSLDSFRK
ncbi:MAG: ClpXP protease specificity-enhancing factor SspB [Pseudomonadota bacterium]